MVSGNSERSALSKEIAALGKIRSEFVLMLRPEDYARANDIGLCSFHTRQEMTVTSKERYARIAARMSHRTEATPDASIHALFTPRADDVQHATLADRGYTSEYQPWSAIFAGAEIPGLPCEFCWSN
jgi:hypothetical protein